MEVLTSKLVYLLPLTLSLPSILLGEILLKNQLHLVTCIRCWRTRGRKAQKHVAVDVKKGEDR